MPDLSNFPFAVAEITGTYTTTRPVTASEVIDFSKMLIGEQHIRGTVFENANDTKEFFILRFAIVHHRTSWGYPGFFITMGSYSYSV